MFQFISRQQTNENVRIMTPVVLYVVGRKIWSSFGNRKKSDFQRFSIFPKIYVLMVMQ